MLSAVEAAGGLGVEPETAWGPGLCVRVCARMYPRVPVRVCRLPRLCPERGPSSAVQRDGTHSLRPTNKQLALLGGRLGSLARGRPRGCTRAGCMGKPPILHCGENARENLPWVFWRPILSAANSCSH